MTERKMPDPAEEAAYPSIAYWKDFSKPPDTSTIEEWIAAERDATRRYYEHLIAAPSPLDWWTIVPGSVTTLVYSDDP